MQKIIKIIKKIMQNSKKHNGNISVQLKSKEILGCKDEVFQSLEAVFWIWRFCLCLLSEILSECLINPWVDTAQHVLSTALPPMTRLIFLTILEEEVWLIVKFGTISG